MYVYVPYSMAVCCMCLDFILWMSMHIILYVCLSICVPLSVCVSMSMSSDS